MITIFLREWKWLDLNNFPEVLQLGCELTFKPRLADSIAGTLIPGYALSQMLEMFSDRSKRNS